MALSAPDSTPLVPPLVQAPIAGTQPLVPSWQSWFAQVFDKLNKAFFGGWQSYTPALSSGGGSLAVTSPVVGYAAYCVLGSICSVEFYVQFTTSGTGGTVLLSLPFAQSVTANLFRPVIGWGTTGASDWIPLVAYTNGSSLFIFPGGDTNTNFSAGAHLVSGSFSYRIS
jgi:hypothetical protein